MSEILLDYFKGFKNYFKTFSKAKAYKITKIAIIIFIFIIFNIIAIVLYAVYKLGKWKAYREMNDSIEKKTPTYLSGIHTKPKQELISISEVNLSNKKSKNNEKKKSRY